MGVNSSQSGIQQPLAAKKEAQEIINASRAGDAFLSYCSAKSNANLA
jgi:hypothetical protein